MMEIARKGLFFPHQFSFSQVIIIFLAVMITDVILLDLFNPFGLPTSTTVSIVFELLGASLLGTGKESPMTVAGLGPRGGRQRGVPAPGRRYDWGGAPLGVPS